MRNEKGWVGTMSYALALAVCSTHEAIQILTRAARVLMQTQEARAGVEGMQLSVDCAE